MSQTFWAVKGPEGIESASKNKALMESLCETWGNDQLRAGGDVSYTVEQVELVPAGTMERVRSALDDAAILIGSYEHIKTPDTFDREVLQNVCSALDLLAALDKEDSK